MQKSPNRSPLFRRLPAGLALALGFTTAVLVGAAGDEPYARLRVMTRAFQLVSDHYVEPIGFDRIIDNALDGVLVNLDPHSSYITREEFQAFQESTRGVFGGVGMEVTIRDGILTVISPIEGTPASRAGLQAGDRIMRIENTDTFQMTLEQAVDALKGEPGTKVTLEVMREGWEETRSFTLEREIIRTPSVEHRRVSTGMGYARIAVFQEHTAEELDNAIDEMAAKAGGELKGMILDLRRNPGGLLNQAIEVSDIFLESGIVVTTRGRGEEAKGQYNATPNRKTRDFPLVVMIDAGSASASEIVAGALQDHARAVVVGEPSFGKGSVQTIYRLEDGSALRLTTALYYTPKGRSIQARGIEPDIVVARSGPLQTPGVDPRTREADLPGHLENGGGPDALKSDREEFSWWKGDAQIERAVTLLEGHLRFEQSRRLQHKQNAPLSERAAADDR